MRPDRCAQATWHTSPHVGPSAFPCAHDDVIQAMPSRTQHILAPTGPCTLARAGPVVAHAEGAPHGTARSWGPTVPGGLHRCCAPCACAPKKSRMERCFPPGAAPALRLPAAAAAAACAPSRAVGRHPPRCVASAVTPRGSAAQPLNTRFDTSCLSSMPWRPGCVTHHIPRASTSTQDPACSTAQGCRQERGCPHPQEDWAHLLLAGRRREGLPRRRRLVCEPVPGQRAGRPRGGRSLRRCSHRLRLRQGQHALGTCDSAATNSVMLPPQSLVRDGHLLRSAAPRAQQEGLHRPPARPLLGRRLARLAAAAQQRAPRGVPALPASQIGLLLHCSPLLLMPRLVGARCVRVAHVRVLILRPALRAPCVHLAACSSRWG